MAGDKKMSMKDFYQELQDGRKLELQNLWQRSIMLMTFFVIFFTAYAVLFADALKFFLQKQVCENFIWVYNFSLCFIAFGGLVVSVLWIQMAKGSKLWYEKYESSIGFLIEKDIPFEDEVLDFNEKEELKCKYMKDCYPSYFPMHGYLLENCDDTNDSIFSSAGGEYSVSRINVAIGLFGFLIWLSLIAFHILFLFFKLLCSCFEYSLLLAFICAFSIFIVSVFIIFVSGYTYSSNNKRIIKKRIRKRLKIYNCVWAKSITGIDEAIRKNFVLPSNTHCVQAENILQELKEINKKYAYTFEKYVVVVESLKIKFFIFLEKFIYKDCYSKEKHNHLETEESRYILLRRNRDYDKLRHIDMATYKYMQDISNTLYGNEGAITKVKRKYFSAGVIILGFTFFLLFLIVLQKLQFINKICEMLKLLSCSK